MENQNESKNKELESQAESSKQVQNNELSKSLEEVFEEEKEAQISERGRWVTTRTSSCSATMKWEKYEDEKEVRRVFKDWGDEKCYFCSKGFNEEVLIIAGIRKFLGTDKKDFGMVYKGKTFCESCWTVWGESFDQNLNRKGNNKRGFIVKMLDKIDQAENQVLKSQTLTSTNLLKKLQAREEAREEAWEIEKSELMKNKEIIEKNLEKAFWRERHERERENKQKDEKIVNLNQKIAEAKEEAEQLKQERQEKREQQKKLLETQNQLHSPDKVDLEALKVKHAKLELQAKTNQEILDFYKVKIDDYKLAIEQLKEEREREEKEKDRFLQLYLNQKDIEIADHAEIAELKVEWNATKRELENEKKDFERQLEVKQIELDTYEYEKEQEKKEYEQQKQGWKDSMDKRLLEFYKEVDKNTQLENQATNHLSIINNLTTQNQQLDQRKSELQAQLTAKEKELADKVKQKRLGNLFAVGVLASDYLPLPKKWNSAIKHGFEVGQGYQIIKDLPNAAYEVIIGLAAVLVFFLIRSIKRRFFGYKEINKLAELRGELQDARGKVIMLTEEKKELTEKHTKELATVKNFSPTEQPKTELQEFSLKDAETPPQTPTKKSKKPKPSKEEESS